MNQAPQQSARFRFSLGTILMALSVISLGLGLVRAVPMSDEMRVAMIWLAAAWGAAACIAIGPGWFQYRRLQRDLAARQAEMNRWAEDRREQAKHNDLATGENPPSDSA